MGIKIGIDPSGTGTTGIVVYKDNKLIKQQEFTDKLWLNHKDFILHIIWEDHFYNYLNIENCLYTNANGSKDRDDLLRLLGVIEDAIGRLGIMEPKPHFNWVSPRHTKSVVKNMENLSKYNDGCLWKYEKNTNLTYEYGKGWFYNNEKISNHLRDAIIIANYED